MKTSYIQSIIISVTFFVFTLPVMGQSSQVIYSSDHNSGSLTLLPSDCQNPSYWDYTWQIHVPINSPIKLSFIANTYDYVEVYTDDNNTYSEIFMSDSQTQTGSGQKTYTFTSTTGIIYVNSSKQCQPIPTTDVFILSFTICNIVNNDGTHSTGDVFIDGKLGLGTVTPVRKFEIWEGSAGRFTFSAKYCTSGYEIAQTIGDTCYRLNVGSSVRGYRIATNNIDRLAITNTGLVGIGTPTPSSMLEVNGDVFENSDNSVITIKDDNIGLVKKAGASGVWAVGSGYYHSFGKWSTPTLRGNVSSGIFTEQMRIDNNGNMGIATPNTNDRLEVNGNINLNNQYSSTAGCLNPGYYVYKSGTIAYGMKLQSTGGKYGTMIFGPNQSDRFIGFGKVGAGFSDDQMIEYMRIDLNKGFVGIGTSNPQNMLDVKGTIRANEVLVQDISQFMPDFVFENDYSLPTLNNVSDFIKVNKHLQNMPSAKQVKENGMSLVDMQLKLLQKVEELTLYVIDQQKEINQLKQELNETSK